MAESRVENVLELPSLVYRLCSKLTPFNTDKVSKLYSTTNTLLTADNQQLNLDDSDEFYVIEKIKKHLIRNMKESEALRFEELYYKLKRLGTCKKSISLAIFLYEMAISNNPFSSGDDKLSLLVNQIPAITSNGYRIPEMPLTQSNGSTFKDHPYMPIDYSHFSPFGETNHLPSNLNNKPILREKGHKTQRPYTIHVDTCEPRNNFSDIELLREILFAFQGLNGRILTQDPNNEGRYKINSQYSLHHCERQIVLRLTTVGWLFNKVNKFYEHTLKNDTLGYMCQSFASALQEEVQNYYRLVTIIEQELHSQSIDPNGKCRLTLLRLQVYIYDSFHLLKVLATLIDYCKHKRGGSLVNIVYKYNRHGDPDVRNCISRIMRQVVLPIRQMLSQWIFHGEIDDPYKEFFIATSRSSLDSPSDPLWHEKYSINKSMLPGFITVDQAKKILATGKAVNLLKQVFEDSSCVAGYDILRKSFESTKMELLFTDKPQKDKKGEFQKLLQRAYFETSQRVLKLLFENYHFMDHLKGLRKFMLLGQGDFIRHLMDLLVNELNKPAHELKLLNLKSLLNSAIRATNAQFLDEDVIERVDVRFSDSLQGSGWDIFTLDYQTDGPINIILNTRCMDQYSNLFKYLWRSKRMEYVLVSLWRKQITHSRDTKIIPKLTTIFHSSYILQAEMMHFIQQMQYYIEFEVLECSWDELIKKIENATDIDQLIEAQENFFNTVIARSMLDSESRGLSEQLRAIYDTIIQFQSVEESLFKHIDEEIQARENYEIQRKESGFSETVEMERRGNFEFQCLRHFKLKIQLISKTYQSMVQNFLLLLAGHQDADLRFLSFRLDYNEHYAKRNPHLETSFTYSKHRSSLDSSLIQTKSM